MRWAVYDLRGWPPSFDFLAFVILAIYHGARGIHFIPGICKAKLDYYNEQEQLERQKTILEPICDLYGLPYRYGQIEDKRTLDVAWPPFWRSTRPLMHGYTWGWMRSIKEPEAIRPTKEALEHAARELEGTSGICVHLRSGRNLPGRNSGADWVKWARDHGAYVLPDHSEVPIPLALRVAFHELARLNIGAAAGHMTISVFSAHRPYINMKFLSNAGISTTESWHKDQGFYKDDQMPWAGKHQRLVWTDRDDYEAIEEAYQLWVSDNT